MLRSILLSDKQAQLLEEILRKELSNVNKLAGYQPQKDETLFKRSTDINNFLQSIKGK